MDSPLKSMKKGYGVAMSGKGMSGKQPDAPKGRRPAGVYFKKPSTGKLGSSAKDAGAGASGLPKPQSSSDKKMYKGVAQPIQYSNANGPQPTRFVC